MENQVIRLFILVVLVFLLTSDIKDLLDALSTTSTVGPYLSNWRPGKHQHGGGDGHTAANSRSGAKKSSKNKVNQGRGQTLPNSLNDLSDEGGEDYREDEFEPPVKYYNPVPPRNRRIKRRADAKFVREPVNPDDIFASLTDEEKEGLINMRSQMTKVMQEWCLPKLVCELYASIGERQTPISEAEQGLLTIIKDTSWSLSGDLTSKYHFAAHMGQLMQNVEGNGCYNFYPNCPLSGPKVLQMVKKVRFK